MGTQVTGGARVPAYRAADVRAAEAPLLAAGEPLMARAAHALAVRTRERLIRRPVLRLLVVAGGGDNGGDALFAAAEVATDGIAVDVLLVSDRAHASALAAARAAGAREVDLDTACRTGYGVVLDGMVGLGGHGELRGSARTAAIRLSAALGDATVIAVDLPSGLDADTGRADDAVLAATETLTFGAVKAGLVRDRGPHVAGRLLLVDIGLSAHLAGCTPVAEAEVAAVIPAAGGQRA